MKVNVNEIKPGYIIEYRDWLWTMVKGEHVKPGKGPAYLQAELKCLTDGSKLNQRFNTSETVEQVELDREDISSSMPRPTSSSVMNQASFEQVSLTRAMVGEPGRFLKEGMTVNIKSTRAGRSRSSCRRRWHSRSSRPTRHQGPDRRLLLQARHPGERGQGHGAAPRRGRDPDRGHDR